MTSAQPLYVGIVRDRHGEQDEHMAVLVPGRSAHERGAWIVAVLDGVVEALGRSGHLVEIVISGDESPVLGIGCPVDDAVTAIVAYLRRLEADESAAAEVRQ